MTACKRGGKEEALKKKKKVGGGGGGGGGGVVMAWEEVRTYQLRRLIKVMVAHVHSILGHTLVRLIVQIAEERDKVLF